MAKITLPSVVSGYNLQKINDNDQAIATELNENVLYRRNPEGEPNEMHNPLDMNSERIYNLPAPAFDHEPVRLKDINGLVFNTGDQTEAKFVQFDPYKTLDSENVQGAIYELKDEYDALDLRVQAIEGEEGFPLSFLDFNIVPNIGDDQYEKIQEAIDTAHAQQRALFIPGGQYLISKPLVIQEHMNIIGEGSFRTQIVKTARDLSDIVVNRLAPGNSGSIGNIFDQYETTDAVAILYPPANGTYCSNVTIKGVSFMSGGVGQSSVALFAPRVSQCVFEDLRLQGAYKGWESSDAWMISLTRVAASDAEIGFHFKKDVYAGLPAGASNAGTSVTANSCWAHDISGEGWVVTGLNYSVFNACGADNIVDPGDNTARAYRFESCKEVVLNGCGCENINGGALYINYSQMSVNGFQALYGIYSNPSYATTAVALEVLGESNVSVNDSNFNTDGTVTKLTPIAVYGDARVRLRGNVQFNNAGPAHGVGGVSGNGQLLNDDLGAGKAYVRFTVDGAGAVTIVSQYRVASVTRNSVGNYTVVRQNTDTEMVPQITSATALVTHSAISGNDHTFETKDIAGANIDSPIVTWVAF